MRTRLVIAVLSMMSPIAFGATEDEIYARGAAEHVREALQQKVPIPWKEGALAVPSAEVAKTIHSAVAGAAYGKKQLAEQRPFRAIRSGEFWVVYGSLPPGFVGGTAVTVIRARRSDHARHP